MGRYSSFLGLKVIGARIDTELTKFTFSFTEQLQADAFVNECLCV